MKGTTNAAVFNPEAYVSASYADDKLTLTKYGGEADVIPIEGGAKAKLKVQYAGISDLSGIECTITPTGSAGTVTTMTTSSDGELIFTVEAAATYKITSVKDGVGFDSEPTVTCESLVTTAPTISCYVPGVVTVTASDAKGSVYGRVITATCDGQTTQTKTVTASGSTGTVEFSLPAGEWTLSIDYPDGATGGESKTLTVEVNQTYEVSLAVIYNLVYGAAISVSTADPASRVTYPATLFGDITNNAYGFTPCTNTSGTFKINGWEGCNLISEIKRQIGNATAGWTDIANSAAWQAGSGDNDMMTYVPTRYFRMNLEGTDSLQFAFSMEKLDGFYDYAGSVGTERIGHFRIGCFAALNSSSKLYSRGNTAPTTSISITNSIAYAKARGTGYDIMTWYQWTYLTALAVLLFKSTDLQTAFASGYVSGSAIQSETSLPFANEYGMYGVPGTSGTTQMAFFWIQNLWGNMLQWCGGAKTNSSSKLLCQTGYSSVTESDYDVITGQGPSSSISGYITKVSGTTDSGFFPTECGGSGTTYFADGGSVYSSGFPIVGGGYNNGDYAGPFVAYFDYSASSTSSAIGARLSYRL